MYEINLTQRHLIGNTGRFGQDPDNRHSSIWNQAVQMFWQAYSRGQAYRAWRWLTRRPIALYDLNRCARVACPQCYAGMKTVPIANIIGSEGRTHDFDRDFHPLNARTRLRWTSVAVGLLQGTPIPPVTLIQVGDYYFVRDGHHRISVRRAWGQEFIEAEVTVWQVPHPLPWEAAVPAAAATTLRRQTAECSQN